MYFGKQVESGHFWLVGSQEGLGVFGDESPVEHRLYNLFYLIGITACRVFWQFEVVICVVQLSCRFLKVSFLAEYYYGRTLIGRFDYDVLNLRVDSL